MSADLDTMMASTLLREIRMASGLSQRGLAELAGTSGPTVAAYESGTKEPRLSTMQRLASSVCLRVDVRLAPAGRGARQRARRERRSIAIAAATAMAVERDFPAACRLAEQNLDRAAAIVVDNVAHEWIEEWRRVIDRGPRAVRRTLLDTSEHGNDMRQMAPFAGLLSEGERAAALAATDAFDVSGQLGPMSR